MAEPAELLDYDEDEELTMPVGSTTVGGGVKKETAVSSTGTGTAKDVKKGYVGIHSTGFRDFLLKPELLKAIHECGFEHPSEGSWIFVVVANDSNGIIISFICMYSSTRVHSTSNPGNGCVVSSKVRDGQDGCLCVDNLATS